VTELRQAIFVVGMGRSGSSALARVLSLCGGELPLRLLPPNFGNPTGYWEPQRAVELNDEFLHARGSSWYDPTLELQQNPPPASERRAFIAEIMALLESEFDLTRPIVLKEPRISGLLPYWIVATTGLGFTPKFVQVLRSPCDVAASLAERDDLPQDQSFALWLKYNILAERGTRGAQRVFISYEDLMRDWETVTVRCIATLGAGLAITAETRAAVEQFLSQKLHHHNAEPPDEAPDDPLAERVLRSYRVLREATSGALDTQALDEIWAALTTERATAAAV
jgi:hypothetical protein